MGHPLSDRRASPGVTSFKSDPEKFYFCRSLVDGLSPDDAFWAAMNARSSMCDKKLGTGHAGALTRELVFALWPFKIVSRNCGVVTIPRSVVNFRELQTLMRAVCQAASKEGRGFICAVDLGQALPLLGRTHGSPGDAPANFRVACPDCKREYIIDPADDAPQERAVQVREVPTADAR